MAKKKAKKKKRLSPAKARKILADKKVRGKKLTERQRRFMGLVASGKVPTRLGDVPASERANVKFT